MSTLFTRIRNTHDTEENWNKCPEFVPKQAEMIVYDVDKQHSVERVKIGDGITPLKDLPFFVDYAFQQFFTIVDGSIIADGGRITQYKTTNN